MKINFRYFFIIIILLAAALRLYNLDNVPPGINRDEASIGYTAYSLATTGKDEYGRLLPLSFESFGDWKLPLYIYTTIPFVKIFGLSELAVRLPSAIAGIMSVAAIYYLAKLLFASETIALLSSLVLAIMPWHIHISRVESEAITAVLFTILGTIWYLLAVKKKSLAFLIAAAVIFSLTYYTYHGNHIFTSLLLAGILFFYRQQLIKIPRFWIALGTGVILTLTILSVTFSADHTKISGISIFGDPTVIHNHIELPRQEHRDPHSLAARLTHNRITYAVRTVFENYLRSYGPEFLFIKGGGNRAHNIEGYGNLHPIEAPLLLLGVVWLISGLRKKENHLVVWWLIIGGVAAAITKDAPHSNRMLAVVPALALTTAAGINELMRQIPKKASAALCAILIIFYGSTMGYYLDRYYAHFPVKEAANWGYAYKMLTPLLMRPENSGKDVIMTHPETSPYIYVLFYSGYNPRDYQQQAVRYPISRDGFTDVAGFGRFSFRAIDWDKDMARPNTLLIVNRDEAPDTLGPKITATIRLPDNTAQFVVIDTDK